MQLSNWTGKVRPYVRTEVYGLQLSVLVRRTYQSGCFRSKRKPVLLSHVHLPATMELVAPGKLNLGGDHTLTVTGMVTRTYRAYCLFVCGRLRSGVGSGFQSSVGSIPSR